MNQRNCNLEYRSRFEMQKGIYIPIHINAEQKNNPIYTRAALLSRSSQLSVLNFMGSAA